MKFSNKRQFYSNRWLVAIFAATLIAIFAPQASAQKVLDAPKEKATQQSTVASKSIAVGEVFPEIALKDQDGKAFSLKAALKNGPVVLTVFRSADW